MARLIDRAFDPNRPVKVRRFFVAAGRHWEPGRAFPWKNMALAQRRVKLLFDAGKLMHPETEEVTTPEPVVTPAFVSDPEPELEETPTPDASEDVQDDLDTLTMPELRAIAEAEGAPTRVSRTAQREAIREHRRASSAE